MILRKTLRETSLVAIFLDIVRGNFRRLAILGTLLCGCGGPNYHAKIASGPHASSLAVRGHADRGLDALANHFNLGLSRLYDRWYLRHAQNSAPIPALIILFTKFENSTELPLTSGDIERLCQNATNAQRRFRLHCAIDHSEEQIALELERLRCESHQYKAERDEEIRCVLARAELVDEPAQGERSERAFRLQMRWQNSKTLAEEDEVDERVQLGATR